MKQRLRNTTNDEPDCLCGHNLDEHDEELACEAEDCYCVSYDADELEE